MLARASLIGKQRGWRLAILSFLAGLAMALGNAPFSFPYLILLAIPVLALTVKGARTGKSALVIGWWAGFGYFALSLSWIVEPFLVQPEIFGWMAPFALVFLGAGLALFWAIPFFLAHLCTSDPVPRILALILFWSLSEYTRSHVFTGFPWALVGYTWAETPIIQLTSLIGIHGLGLFTLLTACLPVLADRPVRYGIPAMVTIFALAWGYGVWRLPALSSPEESRPLVRLVQPNASQHLKWRGDMAPVFFKRQLELTAAHSAQRPDLVVWPETAIVYNLDIAPMVTAHISAAAGPTTEVVSGFQRWENDGIFNSIFLLNGGGEIAQIYDKHHLVPFGEYIPFAGLLRRFGLHGLADIQGGGFLSGPGPRLLETTKAGRFLPLICYEAIFPDEAQIPGDRPDWLLHVTNDAWFGTFSGPYQHLAQTRVRAIEQGLSLVRAANTGVSAFIDPYGRILKSLPLGTEGYIDGRIPQALPATIFARWGNALYFGACFLLVVITIVIQIFRSRVNQINK